MKVSVMDKQAFVDLGQGYQLCIGTEREVQEASIEQQIGEMILSAVAWSRFRRIEKGRGMTLH